MRGQWRRHPKRTGVSEDEDGQRSERAALDVRPTAPGEGSDQPNGKRKRGDSQHAGTKYLSTRSASWMMPGFMARASSISRAT